jgi:hemolysin activation/secretion protein
VRGPFDPTCRRPLAGLALVLLLAPGPAHGQGIAPEAQRPGDERIELPPLEEEPTEPAFRLPRPPPLEPGRLSGAPTLFVRRVEVDGATALPPERIAAITSDYENRAVSAEELQRLRNELTLAYVNEGYVNSGAVIPEQSIEDGVVKVRIVEGRLARVDVAEPRWYREDYFRSRLEASAGVPLDVDALEARLQRFQVDPRIEQVAAQLEPGERPGEAVLDVSFEERPPYRLWMATDNHESPSIGAWTARLGFGHDNLLGRGDRLWAELGRSDGMESYEAGYEIPVNLADTTVGVSYRWSRADVVEDLDIPRNPDFPDVPVRQPDIDSRSQTAALRLRHPLIRTRRTALELTGSFEWRESRNFFLGIPTSFGQGPERGVARVTVLRLGADWVHRDERQVLAARSTFSTGLDLLNATVNSGSVPDGQFFAWLGQFQWLRRWDALAGIQTLFRTDVQLATSALLSLEQYAVGGHATVRGYRENTRVRDNAVVSSIEVRIPLYADAAGRSLQLAPFFDYADSWNTNRGGSSSLYSVGVGLRAQLGGGVEAEVYWGEALRDVLEPSDHDLQDEGVHFRVGWSY